PPFCFIQWEVRVYLGSPYPSLRGTGGALRGTGIEYPHRGSGPLRGLPGRTEIGYPYQDVGVDGDGPGWYARLRRGQPPARHRVPYLWYARRGTRDPGQGEEPKLTIPVGIWYGQYQRREETGMSTVATTQGVKELLSQKGVTLGQLVEATKPKPVQTKKKEGKPSRIKQATRTCLEVLDRIFGKVVLPGSVLTEEDMAFVAEEGYSLSVARSDFTARQTDLAKKVAEYITAKAEREGLSGPRDENGNIILARP